MVFFGDLNTISLQLSLLQINLQIESSKSQTIMWKNPEVGGKKREKKGSEDRC